MGYFANEEAGAAAYARALERLKSQEGALPARAMERHSQERDVRAAAGLSAIVGGGGGGGSGGGCALSFTSASHL